ncbi:MAG TPA: hypothetical protein VJ483_08810 [Holophagaceae bacterium]|nr:hypothetical protein [Holophagaceae bacterium]
MANDARPFPLSAARGLGLTALLALSGGLLHGQETAIVSLKDTLKTEVQERTFTLTRDMKVHVYAKGGGVQHELLFAYGWILDAATREVVWQMDGRTAKAEGDFLVGDQYLDLKAGTYEAYYSNHAFGWELGHAHGTWSIDRRELGAGRDPKRRGGHGILNALKAELPGGTDDWAARAPYFGMEIYAKPSEAKEVATFSGPLGWRNEVLTLLATEDGGEWRSAFRLSRSVTFQVCCQGERDSEGSLMDTGWILDARTHQKVWEMDDAAAAYAGGARKNRRLVQTLTLPVGEYLAGYTTDDSHSPAHWNAAPPCDPLRYGLILAVAKDADRVVFTAVPEREPGTVLAALVRIGNDRQEAAAFTLPAAGTVRVYALGEADGREMADGAWITDASGAKVWEMAVEATSHAGGHKKNRMVDQIVTLPAGTYTVHYRSDGSHAYGDWNAAPPRDQEHYGVTVYAPEGRARAAK